MWISRSFSSALIRQVSRRGYAAAAAQEAVSEELRLTLASPTKVRPISFLHSPLQSYFTAQVVKQVDVPTLAGTVGVLAKHVPTIGVLKPGVVDVTDNEGKHVKLFVSSGTFSMNIDGTCQVLAEEILEIGDIDESVSQ